MLVTEEYTDDVVGVPRTTFAGLLKGTSVLPLQNRVTLNNLTTIRSHGAGTLTTRAWETLRAAVAGVALARTVAPGPDAAATPRLAAPVTQDLPRMRRGAERC
ncbi:hypothetical protein [Mycobacterium sp.]|uniref:hypothetical protein n=1 Tax=Mycobacterium sp. TaxID=1785 RepID=UPI002D1FBCE3|nr:hypothetical protein [Mycobacterium sp.]